MKQTQSQWGILSMKIFWPVILRVTFFAFLFFTETARAGFITQPSSGGGSTSSIVNAQTGTTYTVLDSDHTKLVTLSNAAAITVTLPSAAGAGFDAGWYSYFKTIGVGTATIVPTTSTIDGTNELILTTGQSCRITSDGTNYFSTCGAASFSEVDTLATVSARGRTDFGANSAANSVKWGKDANDHLRAYHDPTEGNKRECVAGGIVNGCNYIGKLNDGFSGGFADSTGANIFNVLSTSPGVGKMSLGAGISAAAPIIPSTYDSTRTTISNTASKTTLYTFSLPANTMGASACVEIRYLGQVQQNSGGSFTLYFSFGGTEISRGNSTAIGTTETLSGVFSVCNRGATNSQFLSFAMMSSNTHYHQAGTAAVDTTANVTVTISGQFSVAATDNNAHQDVAYPRRWQ